MRAAPGTEDEALWPMSESLADDIVADEHARATTAGRGSQGGATQGASLRDTIVFAAQRMQWPISITKGGLDSAAPPAAGHARLHAEEDRVRFDHRRREQVSKEAIVSLSRHRQTVV